MHLQNDIYVNYTYTQRGRLNVTTMCEDIPGYADPCPPNSGSVLKGTILIYLFNLVVILHVMTLIK